MKHSVSVKLPVVSEKNRELCRKVLGASVSEADLAQVSIEIAKMDTPAEISAAVFSELLKLFESLRAARTLAREHLAHAKILDENVEQHRKAAKFSRGPNSRMN